MFLPFSYSCLFETCELVCKREEEVEGGDIFSRAEEVWLVTQSRKPAVSLPNVILSGNFEVNRRMNESSEFKHFCSFPSLSLQVTKCHCSLNSPPLARIPFPVSQSSGNTEE